MWSTIRSVAQRYPGKMLAASLITLLVSASLVAGANYRLANQTAESYDPFSSKAEYERFFADHPLLLAKAPDRARFHKESANITDDKRAEYVFTLIAPSFKPTDPSSAQKRIAALRESQAQAKAWIRSQQTDPETTYIKWVPDPDQLTRDPMETPPIPPRQNGATEPGGQFPGTANPTPTVGENEPPASGDSGRFPQ